MTRYTSQMIEEAKRLIGKRVSIRIFQTDMQFPIDGRILNLLNEEVFARQFDNNPPLSFLISFDKPLRCYPYPGSHLMIFHFGIVLCWDSKELFDLINGWEDSLQGGFNLYVLEDAIIESDGRLKKKKIEHSETYGIGRDMTIKLLEETNI